MPTSPVALANDKYRSQLRSTFIDGIDDSLEVTAVPLNVPTIVVVGWNTEFETVFLVTNKTGDSAANYALTGIEKLRGYEGNLAEGLSVNCLNNEEYFNQWGDLIAEVQEIAEDAEEAIGTLTEGWQTIDLNPGFLKPTTTGGCSDPEKVEAATNDVDYDVLNFDTSSDERAYANIHMPDNWDAGVIQFRYIWTAASGTPAQTVTFELKGRAYSDDDAIDQAGGTAVEVSDTLIATGDVHISAWSGDVTLAGTPAAGDLIHLELMRNVSEDNLSADARLIGLQIRFKQTFS